MVAHASADLKCDVGDNLSLSADSADLQDSARAVDDQPKLMSAAATVQDSAKSHSDTLETLPKHPPPLLPSDAPLPTILQKLYRSLICCSSSPSSRRHRSRSPSDDPKSSSLYEQTEGPHHFTPNSKSSSVEGSAHGGRRGPRSVAIKPDTSVRSGASSAGGMTPKQDDGAAANGGTAGSGTTSSWMLPDASKEHLMTGGILRGYSFSDGKHSGVSSVSARPPSSPRPASALASGRDSPLGRLNNNASQQLSRHVSFRSDDRKGAAAAAAAAATAAMDPHHSGGSISERGQPRSRPSSLLAGRPGSAAQQYDSTDTLRTSNGGGSPDAGQHLTDRPVSPLSRQGARPTSLPPLHGRSAGATGDGEGGGGGRGGAAWRSKLDDSFFSRWRKVFHQDGGPKVLSSVPAAEAAATDGVAVTNGLYDAEEDADKSDKSGSGRQQLRRMLTPANLGDVADRILTRTLTPRKVSANMLAAALASSDTLNRRHSVDEETLGALMRDLEGGRGRGHDGPHDGGGSACGGGGASAGGGGSSGGSGGKVDGCGSTPSKDLQSVKWPGTIGEEEATNAQEAAAGDAASLLAERPSATREGRGLMGGGGGGGVRWGVKDEAEAAAAAAAAGGGAGEEKRPRLSYAGTSAKAAAPPPHVGAFQLSSGRLPSHQRLNRQPRPTGAPESDRPPADAHSVARLSNVFSETSCDGPSSSPTSSRPPSLAKLSMLSAADGGANGRHRSPLAGAGGTDGSSHGSFRHSYPSHGSGGSSSSGLLLDDGASPSPSGTLPLQNSLPPHSPRSPYGRWGAARVATAMAHRGAAAGPGGASGERRHSGAGEHRRSGGGGGPAADVASRASDGSDASDDASETNEPDAQSMVLCELPGSFTGGLQNYGGGGGGLLSQQHRGGGVSGGSGGRGTLTSRRVYSKLSSPNLVDTVKWA